MAEYYKKGLVIGIITDLTTHQKTRYKMFGIIYVALKQYSYYVERLEKDVRQKHMEAIEKEAGGEQTRLEGLLGQVLRSNADNFLQHLGNIKQYLIEEIPAPKRADVLKQLLSINALTGDTSKQISAPITFFGRLKAEIGIGSPNPKKMSALRISELAAKIAMGAYQRPRSSRVKIAIPHKKFESGIINLAQFYKGGIKNSLREFSRNLLRDIWNTKE